MQTEQSKNNVNNATILHLRMKFQNWPVLMLARKREAKKKAKGGKEVTTQKGISLPIDFHVEGGGSKTSIKTPHIDTWDTWEFRQAILPLVQAN